MNSFDSLSKSRTETEDGYDGEVLNAQISTHGVEDATASSISTVNMEVCELPDGGAHFLMLYSLIESERRMGLRHLLTRVHQRSPLR